MQRTNTGELAVIIGAGFGGLAAAVRLRALGYRVLVLEALDRPGGRARVFEQDGFRFDAGPTLITAPHLLDDLFARAGRDTREYFQLVEVDPVQRILFDDGTAFDWVADEERLIAGIRALSPRDVEGYRRLVAHARRIAAIGPAPLTGARMTRLGDVVRTVAAGTRLGSRRSLYALVARYIADERLRRAFTLPALLAGGSPDRTPAVPPLIRWLLREWGAHHASGGTGAIVRALGTLLHELGVEVRLNTPVEEVRVRDGRAVGVLTGDGRFLPCSLIVSDADPACVFTRMITPGQAARSVKRARRMRTSMGLFVGCFGANRTYPDVAHHTVLLGTRYRGLLDDVVRRRRLPPDFLLSLQTPSRTDPSLAPPGREAFHVTSPVPNNRSGVDWSERAAPYFDEILSSLEARLLPDLRAAIVTRRTFTPDDFENELRSADGAAFGPEPTLLQATHRRYASRAPDVERLYFVGAGTQPGAGLPGALASAEVLERMVPPAAEPVPLPHLRVVRDRPA